MISEPLLAYIRERAAAGASKEEIVRALLSNGWQVADINAAFAAIETPASPVTPAPLVVAPETSVTPIAVTRAAQSFSMTAQPQSRGRWIVPTLAAIVILLAGAGGAYAYVTYMSAPQPMALFKDSIANAITMKTFAVSATTTSSIVVAAPLPTSDGKTATSTFTGTVTSNVEGNVDRSSTSTPKFDLTGAHSFHIGDATSTASVAASLELVYTGNELYANLIDFSAALSSRDPRFAMVSAVAGMANGIAGLFKGTWVSIDSASIASSTPAGVDLTVTTPGTNVDYTELIDYAKGMTYVTSVQDAGLEKTDGVDTYHLKVTLQGDDNLVSIIRKMDLAAEPSLATTTGYEQAMDKMAAAVKRPIDVDYWVGKDDHEVYRIVIPKISATDQEGGVSFSVTTAVEVSLSDFNKPVAITAPAGARPLNEVVDQIFSQMFGAARTRGEDAAIQSDISTIQTEGEIYYGGVGRGSYGPGITRNVVGCTRGVFSDATVTKALASIQKITSAPTCVLKSNGTKAVGYIVAAPLTTAGTYFCADSNGTATTTTVAPTIASTGCGK